MSGEQKTAHQLAQEITQLNKLRLAFDGHLKRDFEKEIKKRDKEINKLIYNN